MEDLTWTRGQPTSVPLPHLSATRPGVTRCTPTRDAESIDKKNDTRRVTIRITHHCGPMHTLEFP